jgi:heme/copper-type cytochrome/quinol oxidase subunit 3
VWFIAAELALFATLLASYFYVRFSSPSWPYGGIEEPKLVTGIILSVILWVSSAPMWWAEHGIKQGNVGTLRLGLGIAFVLGVVFLAYEAYDFADATFSWRTNVYGSLWFTILGFHFAHVVLAVLMNAELQVRAWLGHFDEDHHLAVGAVALYWHFVDAVWVFIFLSLYVSPYLR